MMSYSIVEIIQILQASEYELKFDNFLIETIAIDSRNLVPSSQVLFFCIDGNRIKTPTLLPELIQKGFLNFVIEKKYQSICPHNSVNIVYVENVVESLQKLAKYKRDQSGLKVIAITGSNGKTIVKEWLSEILSPLVEIIKSPKSYNSQVGVPLSVWNIDQNHKIGIFEAGISTCGEMQKLETILSPEIGLLTNIGEAHSEGFENNREKLKEKLRLFVHSKIVVYHRENSFIHEHIQDILDELSSAAKLYSWGNDTESDLKITKSNSSIVVYSNDSSISIDLKSMEDTFVENICHCIALMEVLGYSIDLYINPLKKLERIEMRLELLEGIHHSLLINDTYNSDLDSLRIALNFLTQQSKAQARTVILSDIFQTNLNEEELANHISGLLKPMKLSQLILIGTEVYRNKTIYDKSLSKIKIDYFNSTEKFLTQFDELKIANNVVLVKGARKFEFEKIVKKYKKKSHETYLQIDLNALKQNLNQFANLLEKDTKIMVLLKAHGYGLGSIELAKMLEHQRVYYFAVAYTDEGIELRNAGVKTPIVILNPEINAIEELYSQNLEPEIYSLSFLKEWLNDLSFYKMENRNYPIHIKLETGMHRLGFDHDEIDEMIELLKKNRHIEIKSIFSHLAASDDPAFEQFTIQQIETFKSISSKISQSLNIRPIRHILNSEGIVSYTEHQLDMVRLGIGILGISNDEKMKKKLSNVIELKTKIVQIKKVSKEETVGYSRNGKLTRDSIVGILNIGYADGYKRLFGNGNAEIWIKGQKASTIGNILYGHDDDRHYRLDQYRNRR